MSRVNRFDVSDLAPARRDANGFLHVEGRVARVGVQEYTNEDGTTHKEYRPATSVFEPASMASFKGVPLTDDHPPEMVSPANVRKYVVGSLADVRRDGEEWLIAPMVLYTDKVIADAEAGKVQLSVGYSVELEAMPGEYRGEKYDFVQKNIVVNHTAIVDRARAGDNARMRLDSAGNAVIASPLVNLPKPEIKRMARIRIDNAELDVTEANAVVIQQQHDLAVAGASKRADAALKVAAERADAAEVERKRADGLLGRARKLLAFCKKVFDAMGARMVSCDMCDGKGTVGDAAAKCDYCDGAGSYRMHDKFPEAAAGADMDPDEDLEATDEVAADPPAPTQDSIDKAAAKRRAAIAKVIDARKDARVRLETSARAHLGDKAKFDGKSDLEVKKMVVLHYAPKAKLDGLDPLVIQGRFDACLEREVAAPAPRLAGADRVRSGRVLPMPAARGDAEPDDKEDEEPEAVRVDHADPMSARERMIKRNQDASARPRNKEGAR